MEEWKKDAGSPALSGGLLRGFALFAAAFVLFVSHASFVHAATLQFSPASGTYQVGQSFNVSVLASSTDKAANAFSGTVSFPVNTLKVTGISKVGSIASLWVQDPTFSNQAGTVTFADVVLNPGFTGSNGLILTITFQAIANGSAPVDFSSSSVLANDGLGTEILTSAGKADYNVASSTPVAPAPTPAVGLPPAPVVTSTTQPDPTKWYDNNTATFVWTLPAGVTGMNLHADHDATHVLPDVSNNVTSSYTFTNVDDGTWYFHIHFENANGWGPTTDFPFNIDTMPPDSLTVAEVTPTDPTNPNPSFTLAATDPTSGIDHYEISVDNGAPMAWTDDGTHTYTVPAQQPGDHALTVQAIDKAGNAKTANASFSVAPMVATPTPTNTSSSNKIPLWFWLLFWLFILLDLLLFTLWRRALLALKESARSAQAQNQVHDALDELHEKISRQVDALETKESSPKSLNKEEVATLRRLRGEISRAEKSIRKKYEGS